MASKYTEINTVLSTNSATLIDELNGRQGDNNRDVHFWMKDGQSNHDLTGQTVTLQVKDAQGVVKTASTMSNADSLASGRFTMTIPGMFYQAAGDVQAAFVQIQDASTQKVITTIPITFYVLENTVMLTQSQSQTYIDQVQQTINEFNSRFAGANTNLQSMKNSVQLLQTNMDTLSSQMQTKGWVAKGDNTTFTGNNTFSGNVTATKPINADITGNANTANTAGFATTAGYADTAGGVSDPTVVKTGVANNFIGKQSFNDISVKRLYGSKTTSGAVILGNATAVFSVSPIGVQIYIGGKATNVTSAWTWTSTGVTIPSSVPYPRIDTVVTMPTNSGIANYSNRVPFNLQLKFGADGSIQYMLLRADIAYDSSQDPWKSLTASELAVYGSGFYPVVLDN